MKHHFKKESDKKQNRPKNQKPLIGKISVNAKGVGFVTLEDKDSDVVIESPFLNTALHGDEVEIKINSQEKNARSSGEVLRVLTRVKEKFVGVLQESPEGLFLVPDDTRMYRDIKLKTDTSLTKAIGKKIQVKMLPWTDSTKNPEGVLLSILGNKGDNNVEMKAIVLEKGFETDFPEVVQREAEEEKHKASTYDGLKDGRRDFRDVTTFTIDPADAKDFDDAISYKELGGDSVEVGVHIADVSHYVREGTNLNTEAIKRACSIYLVDRTIPMLPEVLSNDLCSLNPQEDKLAFSAVFVMNKKTAKVSERWFGKTIINSDKRFTYEEAQEGIVTKKGIFAKELETLNVIAKILQREKFASGAIDFEQSEIKFRLDETGRPLEVIRKERLDAHKLVEEFMLLANREVAEFIFNGAKQKSGMVGIYRIHDVPQVEKINDLVLFLKALGHKLPVRNGKVSSKDINLLLKEIEGTPEESLIKTATIRSMSKAVYSPNNLGHFGLAFPYYTHFTSPIRRYPDLLVHRILYDFLTNKPIGKNQFITYKKIADSSTEQEIKAAEAERNSIKLKQVEYMSERIGEVFEGTISGVTEWGIYIEEKQTRCEGMLKLRDMKDDYYMLDAKNYRIIGEKTKKKFSLGDKITFKVLGADVEKRVLDYGLVS